MKIKWTVARDISCKNVIQLLYDPESTAKADDDMEDIKGSSHGLFDNYNIYHHYHHILSVLHSSLAVSQKSTGLTDQALSNDMACVRYYRFLQYNIQTRAEIKQF